MSSNKTLSAIVANKIENQIICGNWQVGSQIPPEQELMQTFDVSRITIREAIKTLVSRDVLEIRRGCGTFVSAVPGLSDDPLGLRFIASDDLNTYLFEARQILEPSVCRLAAQRGDAEELVLLKQLAEDIDELDAQLQGKKTTPEVIQAITAKDIAFHTFLCRMSKNPVFERMLPVIIKSVRASYSLLVPRLSNAPRTFRAIHVRMPAPSTASALAATSQRCRQSTRRKNALAAECAWHPVPVRQFSWSTRTAETAPQK